MAGYKRGGFRGGGGGAFKKGGAKKRAVSDDEGESSTRTTKKSKNEEEDESTPPAPKLQTDDEGRNFIGLNASGKRRVIVDEFKGNPLINIREFWVNDEGDLKPGKKGISLTADQYNMLLAAAPLIEAELTKKKVKVVRPNYDIESGAAKTSEEVEDAGDDDEQEDEQIFKVDNDED